MKKADEVMEEMLVTFRERAKVYGDNYLIIGKVMADLFPQGITLKTEEEHNRYHLFLMTMIKATRAANTGLTHHDSAHDMAVYGAMFTGMVPAAVKSIYLCSCGHMAGVHSGSFPHLCVVDDCHCNKYDGEKVVK